MPFQLTNSQINVGFWFDYGLNYAGGLNYFRNLLYALRQTRADEFRFILFIGNDLSLALEEDFCQFVEIVKLDILVRGTIPWLFHRFAYRCLGSQFFVEQILRRHHIHVVSHPSMVTRLSSRFRLISWIPDFQYLHLPHLFPGLNIEQRSNNLRALHRDSNAVIVSSQDAYKDFVRVTGEDRPERTYILPFVSQLHLGVVSQDCIQSLLEKYQLPQRYLFLPNQFWAHKNHITVFRAVSLLRRKGFEITLVCTGLMNDPNRNAIANKALRVIEDEGLQNYVRLLGSIDYSDVLGLMRASVAVVNPSYFEGWSSSVEEAKSIGKPLIASDLAVHREQAHPTALYFDPDDVSALAAHMEYAWLTWPGGLSVDDETAAKNALDLRTIKFGQRYVQILREVWQLSTATATQYSQHG